VGEVVREVVRLARGLHVHWPAHPDVWSANLLWSEETGPAMMTNFKQPVLVPVVPNKRPKPVENVGIKAASKVKSTNGPTPLPIVQDDISWWL
jgi:hypothetical protein